MELLLVFLFPLVMSPEPTTQAGAGRQVVPIDRCVGSTGPTIANPSGVYSGTVTFTLGALGTFSQRWTIPLKSQGCQTCDPGQYVLGGTHYDLMSYRSGGIDRGNVAAVINSDGDGFLELNGTNCAYISFGLGGSSHYESGHVGPAPGADLKISNGRLTGRLSGYDCFGNLMTADLNLAKQSGAQPSTCPYFGGSYSGSYASSCGGSQEGDVILTQSGCALSGYSAASGTAIQGIITGPNTATFDFELTNGCGGGTGTAHISKGVIDGTYTGTSNGGAECCAPGVFNGSFTLTPE